MLYQPQPLYRLKLVLVFLIVRLRVLHGLLPERLMSQLPLGWNNTMFWVAFRSGGSRVYFEYFCEQAPPDSSEPKVEVEPRFQLTPEQIRRFHEDGYLGPFDLMPPEEMKAMSDHLIEVAGTESEVFSYARGDFTFGVDRGRTRPMEELTKNQRFYIETLNSFERHLDDEALLEMYRRPEIVERCAQLLGPDLLMWHSNHFGVKAHGKGSPWHQASRWLTMDMKENCLFPVNERELFEVTCWIALTDASEEQSCLMLVPGTHGTIHPMKLTRRAEPAGDEGRVYGMYDADYKVELDYEVDPKDIRILPAKAGQFYLFCERVIHGSTDNQTDHKRWAVAGRIARADTRVFTERMHKHGLGVGVYDVTGIKLDRWKVVMLREGDGARGA